MRRASRPMVTVHTDEWCGCNGLPKMERYRATVCHAAGERARDDDRDGSARSTSIRRRDYGRACGISCGGSGA